MAGIHILYTSKMRFLILELGLYGPIFFRRDDIHADGNKAPK